MIPNLIILYKNGAYEYVKETKLKPKHVDRKLVKYILSPDPQRPVYNLVRPCKLLLAAKFDSAMVVELSEVDYEDNTATKLLQLPSSIQTTSVSEFIQYITSIYRINGFASILEEDVPETTYISRLFYPIKYTTKFYDASGNLIEQLDNDKMLTADDVDFPDAIIETCDNIYEYLFSGRSDGYDDILFDTMAIPKEDALPHLIHFEDAHYWSTPKKISKLPMDANVAFSTREFGSYVILTPRVYGRFVFEDRFQLELLAVTDKYADRVTKEIIHKKGTLSQSEVVHLMNIMNYGINNGLYYIYHNFVVNDGDAFITWMVYSDLIVSYINIILYAVACCDTEHVGNGPNQCLTIIHSDKLGFTLTDTQVLQGELKRKLVDILCTEED